MSNIFLLKLVLPERPLLVLAIAFILAHCSLTAFWLFRSSWSAHTKTISAVAALGCLWLLLVQLLQTTRDSGPAMLSWCVAIALQVTLTGLAVMILELSIGYRHAAARSRFSLQYLLVWMTLLAIALGIAGLVARQSGFQLADVPNWQFFTQLQAVALISATLATAIYTGIRLSKTWLHRALTSLAVAIAGAVLAPLSLLTLFGERTGAPLPDLVWLFTSQSLFLIPSAQYLVLAAQPHTRPPDADFSLHLET